MGKLDTVTVNGPEGDVLDWDAVDWRRVEDDVRRLRQRIFTAAQAGDLHKVRNLQKLMLRCRANALLSVRRVTEQNFCIPDLDAFRACLSPVRPTAHAGF
jgi:RNA-directed DNA polymerase